MHPDLQTYLAANGNRFSAGELRVQLRVAGWPSEVVERGLQEFQQRVRRMAERAAGSRQGLLVTGSKPLDWVLGVFGSSFPLGFFAITPQLTGVSQLLVLLGYLIVLAAILIVAWERYPYLARGFLSTLVVVLFVIGADFFTRPTASWWTS